MSKDQGSVRGQLEALEAGWAFVLLRGWRAIAVGGTDAGRWLNDLVTAGVADLEDGGTARSLLLTPTGRIRADFHVARSGDGFLLLQDPGQAALDDMLRPYVLSSDVELIDRTTDVVVMAIPGRGADEDGDEGVVVLAPSVLGDGHDLVVPAGDPAERARERLLAGHLVEVGPDVVEARRIGRGVPRMGTDFGPDALPAEVGLESAIDVEKGCFLGQESVAKVRNLGHPPRVLRHVRSAAALRSGGAVLAEGRPVGEVTSVTASDGSWDAIVRVRWEAAGLALSTDEGPLSLRSAR